MITAKDGQSNPLPFASLDTIDYVNVSTTPVQLSTAGFVHVDVTPTTSDAWIKVESASPTAVQGEGKLIPFGGFRSIKVPKSYYIVSDTEVNVVPYGT